MKTEKKRECRVYKYGVPSRMLSTEDIDVLTRQFGLAHRYRNSLVEIELRRRAWTSYYLHHASSRVCELEAEYEILRLAATEPARKKARAIWKLRQAAARESYKDPLHKRVYDSISARAAEERKSIRAEFREAGLSWGTCGQVDAAAKSFGTGPPPEFRSWRRRKDKAAVQVQQAAGAPIKFEDLCVDQASRANLTEGQVRVEISPRTSAVVGCQSQRRGFVPATS